MRKKLKPLLCCFIVLYSSKAFSQNNTNSATDTLIARFTRALEKDTREKISVHTDKWVYVAGETIWFKAYCQYEISQKLSRVSKTLFVDLVSDKDSVVNQLLLNNQRYMTSGRMALPENLPEGDYWLRAYTNALLKKDAGSVFVKHIYILNPSNSNSILLKKDAERKNDISGTPQITFYPEGGSIIGGTDQVVAFRVTDIQGNPLPLSGYLTNDEDSVLARFSTNSKGLGKFSYFNEGDVKYTVHIKDNNGQDLTRDLPNSASNAARISITKQTDTSITLLVALGDELFKAEAPTTIMGFNKDKLIYAASGKGMYQVDVSKRNLPKGELHFLLFNQQQQIISERAFYCTKNNINIDIKTDKENYQAREKVKLDISVTDANKLPLLSLLSVAVTDDNLIKPSSDMDELGTSEMDLRMLTQEKHYSGWNWQATGNAKLISTDADNQLTGIRGKVFDKKGVPQKNQVVTLFSNKDTDEILVGTDTTNEAGHFNLPLANYTDSMTVQLGVTNLKGTTQDVDIRLDSFPYPVFKTPEMLKVKFNETASIPEKEAKDYLLDKTVAKQYVSNTIALHDGTKVLKSVTVRTWKKKEYTYDESKRVSQFSQILSWDMMANGGVRNISNGLLMVHGVHMMGNQINIHGPTSMSSMAEPLLIVDGVQQYLARDTNHLLPESPLMAILNTYSVDDIDFIEVLTGAEAAYYGTNGGNGVIIINTRTGPRKILKNSIPGLKQFYAKGYLNPVLFVGPDYDKPEIKNSTNPDLRSTLYWNGDLLTDDKGNAGIDFFTADAKTTYSVIIKGVTVNGDIIYKKIIVQRK